MSERSAVFDGRFQAAFLRPRHWPTWFSIGLLALLAWCPVRLRDAFAGVWAGVLIRLSPKQCYIARTNLGLCFPELDDAAREALLKRSVEIGLKCFLAFGEPTFLPKRMLMKRYRLQGWEQIEAGLQTGRPIIFMIPHTWAIDVGGLYFSGSGLKMCTMMHSAKNVIFDWFINRQRVRFGGQVFERSAGIKSVIKSMREGHHFFYLPDQDHGAEASLFVPFFGHPKATLPALPKLARLTDALVFPVLAVYNDRRHEYELIVRPAMADYPSGDVLADSRRMNEEIEVLLDPWREQYMWFLKYFQTRPEGGEGFYEAGIREIRGK